MRYEKTTLTVKDTDSETYPGLYKNLPYSCKINHLEEQLYTKRELLIILAESFVHKPHNFIVFKNKISEKEKVFRKYLDDLVEKRNLCLKLGRGKNLVV